jgi:superfamily II DNA helicase RecQ
MVSEIIFQCTFSLSLGVEAANTLEEKLVRLVSLLKQCSGPSIVYVTLQRHAEEVASQLLPHGFNAMVYHAGLPSEQRAKVQSDFMESNSAVVVCTIAFGMGIDKGESTLPFPKVLTLQLILWIKQIFDRYANDLELNISS